MRVLRVLAGQGGFMTGRPNSFRAAILAAAHCTHPDLDGIDAALLMYLAAYADKENGANSHPGNRNIIGALKLGDTATDDRIRTNLDRQLIERTSRANGRGKASVYRLRFESEYFPDQAPGGEWLRDKPPGFETARSETTNRPAQMSKPPGVNSETARSETGNRPVEEAKPPGIGRPLSNAQQTHIEKITDPPSIPPTAPPYGGDMKPGGKEGGAVVSSTMGADDDPFGETTATHGDEPTEAEEREHAWKDFKRGLPPELEQMVGDDEKNLRAQIEECNQFDCNGLWLNNCGASIVLDAVRRWVAKREADGSPLRTLKVRRWSWWFKECENHFAAVRKDRFVFAWRMQWECAWKTLHVDAFKGEIIEGYTNPLPWDALLTGEERRRMLMLHRANKSYFNVAVWDEKNITHFVNFGIPNGLTVGDLRFVQSIAKRYAPPEPDDDEPASQPMQRAEHHA